MFFCNFSWEGGGTLPQKGGPKRWTKKEDHIGWRLARSFGKDKQTDILLLYYKDIFTCELNFSAFLMANFSDGMDLPPILCLSLGTAAIKAF